MSHHRNCNPCRSNARSWDVVLQSLRPRERSKSRHEFFKILHKRVVWPGLASTPPFKYLNTFVHQTHRFSDICPSSRWAENRPLDRIPASLNIRIYENTI